MVDFSEDFRFALYLEQVHSKFRFRSTKMINESNASVLTPTLTLHALSPELTRMFTFTFITTPTLILTPTPTLTPTLHVLT